MKLISTKRVVGVTAVGALCVGIWLGGWFKGLGLGEGTGQVEVSLDPGRTKQGVTQAASEPGKTAIVPPTVLEVVVDQQEYFLKQAETGKVAPAPLPLEQVVKLATAAKGDGDGYKIKIYRKASSLHMAESILKEELTKAGLTELEIYLHPGIVE
jgi:hypothetical protein